MKCFFGDHYVDPNAPDTFTQITAWVSGPKKNGATLSEETGNVACGKCIGARRLGQDPTQDDLFSKPEPEPEFDIWSPMYKSGWKAGFMNTGYRPEYSRNTNYLAGYGMGQQFKDFLDGFFFFEETP